MQRKSVLVKEEHRAEHGPSNAIVGAKEQAQAHLPSSRGSDTDSGHTNKDSGEKLQSKVALGVSIAQMAISLSLGCLLGGMLFPLVWSQSIVSENLADLALRNKHMATFADWFTSNGGLMHPNMTLRQLENWPDVWGFFATGEIRPSEILTGIPPHMVINTFTAMQALMLDLDRVRSVSSLPREILTSKYIMEQAGFGQDGNNNLVPAHNKGDWFKQVSIVALYLVTQFDNTDSFFYPYFATMPRGCTMSTCWSIEELTARLKPSQVKSVLADRKSYTEFALALGLDVPNFLNKVALISSRCWGVGSDDDEENGHEDIVTLVPFNDMYNHDVHSETYTSYHDSLIKGAYTTYTSEEEHVILEGDEVFISYGDKSNSGLLMNYGYVNPENPQDTCEDLLAHLNYDFIKKHITAKGGINCMDNRIWFNAAVHKFAVFLIAVEFIGTILLLSSGTPISWVYQPLCFLGFLLCFGAGLFNLAIMYAPVPVAGYGI
eukprot:gb/GEZN01005027.1/.p1 GENE.gb/GEZN01005027.1/~~gb/GEZN01005027.1/.p1  ORF type:complete len:491 (-),score=49.84 gb/GEZN01005027.1/:354-1826(-)